MFEAYGDESGFPAERYQAISVVSGRYGDMQALRNDLRVVLEEKGVSELKFEEIRGHRPKVEVAQEFLRYAVKCAIQSRGRVDVLIWDTQDSRHSIVGRDDIANLHRMYYKVLVHVARTLGQREWAFYPDENSGVDWGEIQDFLNKTCTTRTMPNIIALFEPAREFFEFSSISPQKSASEPLVQLADLFAGMAAFSRHRGEEYQKWTSAEERRQQPVLFEVDDNSVVELSKADRVRFALLQEFDALCKRCKLGVSLKTKRYVWTPDLKNPINFWNYEPQHEADKAPTRPPRVGRRGL